MLLNHRKSYVIGREIERESSLRAILRVSHSDQRKQGYEKTKTRNAVMMIREESQCSIAFTNSAVLEQIMG